MALKGAGTLLHVLQLSYSFHQKCSKLDTATESQKTKTRLKIQFNYYLNLFWAHKNLHFKELAKVTHCPKRAELKFKLVKYFLMHLKVVWNFYTPFTLHPTES
jgi:hypothetical protein